MTRTVSNTEDVLDSRDIIARIEELEAERDDFGQGDTESGTEAFARLWAEENPDDAEELRILTALAEEAEQYAPDWKYGEVLIRDSYFEEYAEQLADDIGAIDRNASWPLSCIDWKEAARQLQQDYTAVDFDGATYWVR